MKGAILSSIVTASGVAAQLKLGPGLGHINVAAVDVSDPEYTVCSNAADLVDACVTAAGGADALATNAAEFVGCACCIDSTAIYPVYSGCSVYLSEEAGPTLSDTYSVYDQLYSICGMSADCTGAITGAATGTEDASASSTVEILASTTDGSSDTTSAESSMITDSAGESSACNDVLSMYSSCSREIDGFTELPFGEQATCYCCRSSGGSLTWTDELDKYASTCADWAVTGEPDTVYSVAKTFATFCENFSDACDATATSTDSSESSTTGSSEAQATDNSNDAVTVTVPAPTQTSASSDNGNAAASVRVGCGAVLAAVAALAIAL
ncbi:hypothetical protein BGZ61DRAFT_533622 [Ilyonectria robusta]|uniref:uncharacterized protein n=1 Tax=Ilyonectria robusta TaxID=1079257 RepID=UPI001E8EC439|nr:uncharacterized protein BGZ61DRAFT_533622 [Ilyonectria robusta]KAH8686973.1 hypothetical protein BGZ61DRAFT_533622 [Ilyonectria robusta]